MQSSTAVYTSTQRQRAQQTAHPAAAQREGQEQERRRRRAQEDERRRRQLAHGDADEEIRQTPDHAEGDEEQPAFARHGGPSFETAPLILPPGGGAPASAVRPDPLSPLLLPC